MTSTADLIIERRRMRRRLALWRILAVVAAFGAIVVGIASVADLSKITGGGDPTEAHIARIKIDGVIFSDRDRAKEIKEIAEDKNAKALIVEINSPGGTVTGSEELYDGLRDVAEAKPVVAIMREAAASGGYITAIAADHVLASGNSITGSIGVVFEAPNIAPLLEDIGVDVMRLKSSPLKAEPGFLTPPAEGALAARQVLLEDTFLWFKGLVGQRRQISEPQLTELSDGRIFTGRMALGAGLIDAIGNEDTAREWLEAERGLSSELEIEDRDWRKPQGSVLARLLNDAGESLGLPLPAWRDARPRLGAGPVLMAIMY
ncbi:MAG: signal peptide peptidase SppA [Pseudomonadota bacterium]